MTLRKILKNAALNLSMILVSLLVAVGISELFLYFVMPQPVIYPPNRFSTRYSDELRPDRTIVHSLGRKWEYRYEVNEMGYRGRAIPILSKENRPRVVILGDSYSFGFGVREGEQYASVLAENLPRYDIVNLSVGGWGLTQQIRRFYDFGSEYRPRFVVLQFCSNDPSDNLARQVTTYEGGQFRFHDVEQKRRFSLSMSEVPLLQSQTYMFVRFRLAELLLPRHQPRGTAEVPPGAPTPATTASPALPTSLTPEEEFHISLLDPFARDLKKKQIQIILISVNGQLDSFPAIKQKVMDLDREGIVEYAEVSDWFDSTDPANQSPEGHVWGTRAHKIIGQRLAEIIRRFDPQESRQGSDH